MFLGGSQNSGVAHTSKPAALTAAPEKCPSVQAALRFYTKRWQHWTQLRGAAPAKRYVTPRGYCPRYLLKIRKTKASAARKAYLRYVEYHWHWWKWMDDKWQRVGACETGYGKRPGSFTWDSGTYVSFAGIIRGGYATFAHRLGLLSWDESVAHTGRPPTPRQQVRVATALQAQYGWGAWGCGSA